MLVTGFVYTISLWLRKELAPAVDRPELSGNVAVTVFGAVCPKMGFFGSAGPGAPGRQF
jgi:hypothetical protein